MSLLESFNEIAAASGDGPVDWDAVARAAKASTERGSIALSAEARDAYRNDVRDARDRVTAVSGLQFSLPRTLEIQNRHHWIDTNVTTFARLMQPLAERQTHVPEIAQKINTSTMSLAMAFLGRHVLGQYDPLLLADETEHALYFVHPNITVVANELEVDESRFRRWIAFHEVTHAAEFGAAPWLSEHLEMHLTTGVDALTTGSIDREAFRELDATMTAVEGYAELLMDHAFDREYHDLREKLDERRARSGPIGYLMRRFLGLGIKRRQYERGKAFFEAVAARTDLETAGLVWETPQNLPRWNEFDNPSHWIHRMSAT